MNLPPAPMHRLSAVVVAFTVACSPAPPATTTTRPKPCPSGKTTAVMTAPSLPYGDRPSWATAAMGFYETGLQLADINNDGYPDLITASGNDGGLQPLSVYLNDKSGHFSSRPDLMSADLDANTNLAVGDINHDGFLDVAVATLGSPYGKGGVKVYMNHGGVLEASPSYRTAERFSAWACTLGDADADGDLDLAVSFMDEGGSTPRGYARMYLNDGRQILPNASWRSPEASVGGDILFADVQQDGFLDLVHGSTHLSVYSGAMGLGGVVRIDDTKASWRSYEGQPVFYLTAGPLGEAHTFGLAASRNAVGIPFGIPPGPLPVPRFEAYLPGVSTDPVWTSRVVAPVPDTDGGPADLNGYGSGVRLADVDGDGITDFLGGAWGVRSLTDGGPLQIFLGVGKTFGAQAAFTSSPVSRSIVEAIDVADLSGNCSRKRSFHTTVAHREAAITLPDPIVGAVSEVKINGKVLLPSQYARVPSAAWLSFPGMLEAGVQVDVSYVVPKRVDIATANQDCSIGTYLYLSSATGTSVCTKSGGDSNK